MDLNWREATIEVLKKSDSAMHYSDIAKEISERGLRSSMGATPATAVNTAINISIKSDGQESPFVRVGRGEYFLRSKVEKAQEPVLDDSTTISSEISEEVDDSNTSIIHAFGMFWERESVMWSTAPNILGRQQVGATPVNFYTQIGVYLLHDGKDVVYVGRSIDRPLGKRLYEHTQDRLRGRWNRFSWFGLLEVEEDGSLSEVDIKPTVEMIIGTLEALLIEGLEPPQNRKRGDDFNAVEYLQAEDPEIEKQQMRALLSEMQEKLSK